MTVEPLERRLSELIDVLAEECVQDYRITLPDARELIEGTVQSRVELRSVVERSGNLDQVRRTRAYRDLRKEVRRLVYYSLRRYKAVGSAGETMSDLLESIQNAHTEEGFTAGVHAILSAHSSARERLTSATEFSDQLLNLIGSPTSILDVGSGVYPMMFPFDRLGSSLDRYLALDRDVDVVRAVQQYAAATGEHSLTAMQWSLDEGWDGVAADSGKGVTERDFDVALLLKLVPVVARQEAAHLGTLARVPARRLVVSGSRVGLSKRANIERRERGVLRKWLAEHGLEVEDEFTVGEEFVYLVERPSS